MLNVDVTDESKYVFVKKMPIHSNLEMPSNTFLCSNVVLERNKERSVRLGSRCFNSNVNVSSRRDCNGEDGTKLYSTYASVNE